MTPSDNAAELEQAVMHALLAGDLPVLAALRAQYDGTRVVRRVRSQIGMSVTYAVPEHLLKGYGDLGILAVPFPEQYGGIDGDCLVGEAPRLRDRLPVRLTAGGYLDADSLTTADAWNAVRGVRVSMTLRDTTLAGTDGTSSQPITRTIDNVVTLRNRVP